MITPSFRIISMPFQKVREYGPKTNTLEIFICALVAGLCQHLAEGFEKPGYIIVVDKFYSSV